MAAPRYAAEDVKLGDQLIRAGEMVVAAPTSANRDEAQFTDPEELDIAPSSTSTSRSVRACTTAWVRRSLGSGRKRL